MWNVQINRINSLVPLFDDMYEVYMVEFSMKLQRNKTNEKIMNEY